MKSNSIFEILFLLYIAHWFARIPVAHRDKQSEERNRYRGFAVKRMIN